MVKFYGSLKNEVHQYSVSSKQNNNNNNNNNNR